jgi:hypothetical protein
MILPHRAAALAFGALACIAAPAAWSDAYNPARLNAADLGRVERVCADVVGLPRDGTHFAACVQSLSASLRDLERASTLRQARAACLRQGLAPESAALADCELAGAAGGASSIAAADTQVRAPGRSYFSVSPAEGRRRGQLACAALGFDPAEDAFAACAANLQAALSRQSMP